VGDGRLWQFLNVNVVWCGHDHLPARHTGRHHTAGQGNVCEASANVSGVVRLGALSAVALTVEKGCVPG
jgi:hypothetical protein